MLGYRPLPDREAGRGDWLDAPMQPLENDEWAASFAIDRQTTHEYTVHAWTDRFGSWRRRLVATVEAGENISTELVEGAALLRSVAECARASVVVTQARWLRRQADLIGGPRGTLHCARIGLSDRPARVAAQFADRSHGAAYDRVLTVSVDRERASISKDKPPVSSPSETAS